MTERAKILGVEFDRVTLNGLVDKAIAAIKSKQTCIILNHNLHSLYLFHYDIEFSKCFESAQIIHADGMPLIWWSKIKWLPQINRGQRITYVDLIPALFSALNQEKMRLFFLGGPPEFAALAKNYVRSDYPNIQFECRSGFFNVTKNSAENTETIQAINAFCPDVLLVGMGMPRQEKWIAANHLELNAKVYLAGGACLEYFTGTVSKPPRWIGRLGLEWLFRLVENPNRYYYRYLVEPFYLIPIFLKDVLK